jgi:hypothetical protein
MFDKSKKAVSSWKTVQVKTDTVATVGATTTLVSPYTRARFTDTLAMGGSSYTDSGYVRSMVGTFTVSAVADPSGLESFEMNNRVTSFDTSMIGTGQSVILSKSSDVAKPNNVGVTVTLTDGAGNVETRVLEDLIFDTTAPVVSSSPTATFTAGAGGLHGTVNLSGGAITDDLYPGDSGSNKYWGVWVANAICTAPGSCPADTDTSLNWAAVKTPTYTSFVWNLHHGLSNANIATGSAYYKTYIKFLDGAGNPSSTSISFETTVASTANTLYVPFIRAQR